MANALELFHQYRDDVYRLALSYTKSRQEAEDICQSVFLALLEEPRISPGKEKAWLMQVCANRCKNLLRSHWWRTTSSLEDTHAVPGPEPNPIREAVMALPPKYRVVVYLYYYEGFTTEDIAKLLKVTQSVVSTRLHRARAMLKEQLKEE